LLSSSTDNNQIKVGRTNAEGCCTLCSVDTELAPLPPVQKHPCFRVL
jgi:hypothetical protein